MTEENNKNQETNTRNPKRMTSQLGKQTSPRLVNKVNLYISGNEIRQAGRGFQFQGKRGHACGLRNPNRAGMRLFEKNFPHFVLSGLSPDEERSLLESKEIWLQAQLTAVQNRLSQVKKA